MADNVSPFHSPLGGSPYTSPLSSPSKPSRQESPTSRLFGLTVVNLAPRVDAFTRRRLLEKDLLPPSSHAAASPLFSTSAWDVSGSDIELNLEGSDDEMYCYAGSPSQPSSPVKSAPTTPGKTALNVIKKRLEEGCLHGDLTPAEKREVDRKVEQALKDKADSPNRKGKSKIAAAIARCLIGEGKNLIEMHDSIAAAVKEESWVGELLEKARRVHVECQYPDEDSIIPDKVFHFKHILKGDENGGCHFFPPDLPSIVQVWHNPETGIHAALLELDGDRKFSSSFPYAPNGEMQVVEQLLSGGVQIAASGKRKLCSFAQANEKKTYLAEMIQKSGWYYPTAYPIFYHAVYVEDQTYQILPGELELGSSEILGAINAVIEQVQKQPPKRNEYNPLRYETTDGQLVVDLGPMLRKSEDWKGIYFFVSKELITVAKLEELLKRGN